MNDDGSVLEGEALERYTKRRGLCHLCARTQTHQPKSNLLKRLQTKSNWEPITVLNDQNEYMVYKGFCIQPTCYSLKQAQIILGETPSKANESKRVSICSSNATTEDFLLNSSSITTSFVSQSLDQSHPPDAPAIEAEASMMMLSSPSSTEISSKSATTRKSFSPKGAMMKSLKCLQSERSLRSSSTSGHHSTVTDFSSSIHTSSQQQQWSTSYRNNNGGKNKSRRSSSKILGSRRSSQEESTTSLNVAAMLQQRQEQDEGEGSPMTATATANTSSSNSNAEAATTTNSVGGRLLQYLNDTTTGSSSTTATLDISNIRLTSNKTIPSLLKALRQLHEHHRVPSKLILNKCKLSDRGLATLIKGLEEIGIVASSSSSGGRTNGDDDNKNPIITSISLRHNRFGKKGLTKVSSFLQNIQEIDLSKNKFDSSSSRDNGCGGGAMESTLFGALLSSKSITNLNLSSTKLWECSLTALHFFKTNTTLRVLNLESNYLRDTSIGALMSALKENPLRQLTSLLLADNSFGDQGLESIVDYMKVSTTLRHISIGNNLITNVGAHMILETLRLKKNGGGKTSLGSYMKAPIESIQGLQDNHRITDKKLILQISKQLEVMLHNRNFCRENKTETVIEIGNITFFSNEQQQGHHNNNNRFQFKDTPSTRTETTGTIDTQSLSSPSFSSSPQQQQEQHIDIKTGGAMPPQRRFVIDGDDEMNETSFLSSSEGGNNNKWWMSTKINRSFSNASISDVSSAGGGGGYSTTASSSVMTGDSCSTVGSISLVDPKDYIVSVTTSDHHHHHDDNNTTNDDAAAAAGSLSSIFNIEFNQSISLLFDDDDGEEVPVEQGFEIDLPSITTMQEKLNMSSLSTIDGTTTTTASASATFTC